MWLIVFLAFISVRGPLQDTKSAFKASWTFLLTLCVQDGSNSEPARLHVGHLTRNVTDEHVKEIFGTFGKLKSVELAIDRVVNLPRCSVVGRVGGSTVLQLRSGGCGECGGGGLAKHPGVEDRKEGMLNVP
mgnify:FL=1